MFKGIIERRTTNRIPFKAPLQIKLINEPNTEKFTASYLNLSTEEMRFSISNEFPEIPVGEILEFILNLPDLGQTSIIGEIVYSRADSDFSKTGGERFYEVKFADLSLSTWKHLVNQCYADFPPAAQNINGPAKTHLKFLIENKEYFIEESFLSATIQYGNSGEIPIELEDIGFGGTRIALFHPISVNTKVILKITYKDEQSVTLNGICVWSAQEYNGADVAGIFFNSLTDEQFSNLTNLMKIWQS